MPGPVPRPAVAVNEPTSDGSTHLEWAAKIARRLARRWHFKPDSQEEADLVSVAHLAVTRKAFQFEPAKCPAGGCVDGLFRGWARVDVSQEVKRECRRLLNAGSYWTRREHENPRLIKGYSFSDLAEREPTGEYDIADPFGDDDGDGADGGDDLEPPARAGAVPFRGSRSRHYQLESTRQAG